VFSLRNGVDMLKVLLVDNTESQRAWLRMIIQRYRGDWDIIECARIEDVFSLLHDPGVSDLAVAVVDQFLTVPPSYDDPEGNKLLVEIRQRYPRCYCILIVGKNVHEWQVPNDGSVDEFVSVHVVREDRQSQLENALDHAIERISQLPTLLRF